MSNFWSNFKNVASVVAPVASQLLLGPQGAIVSALITAVIAHKNDPSYDAGRIEVLKHNEIFLKKVNDAEKIFEEILEFFKVPEDAQDEHVIK